MKRDESRQRTAQHHHRHTRTRTPVGAGALLALAALLIGCPGNKPAPSSLGPESAGASPVVLGDEAEVLKVDASTAPVQSALQSLATDPSQRSTLRLAALRKLEEVGSPVTLSVAEGMATSSTRSAAADFLRKNAVLLICQDRSPAGLAVRERVKVACLDNAVLVARLSREESK